uniref:Uncharacterized protein n=1 Tax=Oryza nivara TaxID=4536 RepID=A0A0E0FI23_ORYNI
MSPPPHPPSAPPIRSPFHRLLLRPPPRPPVPPIRRPRQGAVLPAYVAYSDTAALRSPNPYDNKSGNGASADCAFHLLDEIGLRQRRTPASSRAPRRSLTLLARAHCSPCWTLRPRMAFRPTWRARCSSGFALRTENIRAVFKMLSSASPSRAMAPSLENPIVPLKEPV